MAEDLHIINLTECSMYVTSGSKLEAIDYNAANQILNKECAEPPFTSARIVYQAIIHIPSYNLF